MNAFMECEFCFIYCTGSRANRVCYLRFKFNCMPLRNNGTWRALDSTYIPFIYYMYAYSRLFDLLLNHTLLRTR